MHILRKLCALLAALLLAATPALAASMKVVTNHTAAVYRSASSGSDSVSVREGLEMKLVGYEGGWAKVKLYSAVALKPLAEKTPSSASRKS